MSSVFVRVGGLCAALLVLGLVSSAFADELNITKKAYDKIEVGMTMKEVEKILGGKGEERAEGEVKNKEAAIYEWKEKGEDKWIRIEFVGGKVKAKAEKNLSKK